MQSTISRRQFVNAVAGGAVAAALPCSQVASAADRPSLKALAAAKGVLFGSCVGAGPAGTLTGSLGDPGYAGILEQECAVLVPENELKSYVIAAGRAKDDFEPADRIANFAKAHGMKLRGHTLLWNRAEFMPGWLRESFGALSADEAEKYLRGYIRRVCLHYGDSIHSWDVVNETVHPKTGKIRDTPFTKVLGFDVLRIAFEAAREHAPHAQLVYNDYMSWEAGNEQHRDGVLRLLEQFKSRNIPVDALGVQSHIGNDGDLHAAQHKQWRTFIDAVVGMDYKLLVTEFDVNDKDLPTDARQRDVQVAAAAREYLDLMLAYEQLDQVLCWGMVDKFSWLQNFSPRADRSPQRPNPYDATYRAKPLRAAIAAAFAAAPARSS